MRAPLAGDEDGRPDPRKKRAMDDKNADDPPEKALGDKSPESQEASRMTAAQGDGQPSRSGSKESPGEKAPTQPVEEAAGDGSGEEALGETGKEDGGSKALPEGFEEPNKKPSFSLSEAEDDNLPREANILVPDYDQFLEGHGQKPTKTDEQVQADADSKKAAEEATWAPLELDDDAGWLIAAMARDGSGDGSPEKGEGWDGIKNHRFGLRLGRHRRENFLSKLKAKFSKEDPDKEPEPDLQQDEEAQAAQERIEPNERYKEIEVYPIRPPYGNIRILFDEENKEYVYQVLEPVLAKTEQEILDFIEESLVDSLTVGPQDLEEMDDREFITERFNDVLFDYSIILDEDEEKEDEIKRKLLYYVLRDFIGHGRIDLIMEDPYIEDISCDGPHIPVFLYHRKYESVRSTVVYPDHHTLDSFVIKMAQRSSKHISIAEPILDATLPDGSRLQSTLGKEVSAGGSTFTIRKFRPDPFTPPDLVLFRTMSAQMLAYLWIAVQHSSSVLYSGGTASGKTTSLNAILLFIPPQMKIVTIEDTREVNLPHENWIAGITRHGFGPRDQFGRQAGEIDMFQLLKNALRQRPEYIIVGEVRGHEAYSLFQAMATGHAAYGTMHADSVDAVIHRLESDPINIPRNLLEALDVVSVQIQTRVGGKRVRRTKQISEIVGIDPHTQEILTNEVFRWVPKDDSFKFSGISYVLERIQLEKALPDGSMIRELSRRAQIIEWMIEKRIQDYREVSRVVSSYYREPENVIALVEGRLSDEEIPPGLRQIALRSAQDKTEDDPLSAAALESSKVSDGSQRAEPGEPGEQEGSAEEEPVEAPEHEDPSVPEKEPPLQDEAPPLAVAQADKADDTSDPVSGDEDASPITAQPTETADAGRGQAGRQALSESQRDAVPHTEPVSRQKAHQPHPSELLRRSAQRQSEAKSEPQPAPAGGAHWGRKEDEAKTATSEADSPEPKEPAWGGAAALMDAARRREENAALARSKASPQQKKTGADEKPPERSVGNHPSPASSSGAPVADKDAPQPLSSSDAGAPQTKTGAARAARDALRAKRQRQRPGNKQAKGREGPRPPHASKRPEGLAPEEAEAWLSQKEKRERERREQEDSDKETDEHSRSGERRIEGSGSRRSDS